MESNVVTWNGALEKGFQPQVYSFKIEQVPMGVVKATLDFKIWSKTTMGISCYFTELGTGKKFQLMVFRRHSDKEYKLEKGELDFKCCAVKTVYVVRVELNGKGKVIFNACTLHVS